MRTRKQIDLKHITEKSPQVQKLLSTLECDPSTERRDVTTAFTVTGQASGKPPPPNRS